MRRCDCERGGDCSKTSVCEVTNLREEYESVLRDISDSVDRMEAIIRNDLYKNRIRNVLDEIDEVQTLIKNADLWIG